VSIGALIVFIDHAAQSIRASVILQRETRRTLDQMERLFAGAADDAGAGAVPEARPLPETLPLVVRAEGSGYLQAVHERALWRLGASHGRPVVVRMEMHVGSFAIPGKPLASVDPAGLDEHEVAAAVREAFVFGPERTPEQDVEFGIIELADIAVKALSPGINDPTTAMSCIDRLAELLAALASHGVHSPLRTSPDATVHLHVLHLTFERAAGLAFDQIRHYGGDSPAIVKKLLDAILDLGGVVPPAARPPLARQVESLRRVARRRIDDPAELAEVERLAREALDAVGDVATGSGGTG
jgi:uncharacterized membrane protein